MSSRLRLALICALTSCFCLLVPAAASASTIKSIKVVASPQDDGSYAGTATCPEGRRVVSGGFAGAASPSVVTNRAVGKTAWTVRAFDTEGITVVAYCSKYLKPTSVSASGALDKAPDGSQQGDNLQQGGAEARCPSGTRVISGGWEYANPVADSPVYTSRPVGSRDWNVYAAADDVDNSITAYAYCLGGKKVEVRAGSKAPLTFDRAARAGRLGAGQRRSPDGTTLATSTCKSGETLFGGGYETTPTPDYYNQSGPDTFFGKSARFQRNGWKAYAMNYSGFTGGDLQAFAICRAAKK